MDQKVLQQLSVVQLQAYKKTLHDRIKDLRTFELQLNRENIQIKKQAHSRDIKKGNIGIKNFNFDDIYTIGKQKIHNIYQNNKGQVAGLSENIKDRSIKLKDAASELVNKYIFKSNSKANKNNDLQQKQINEINYRQDFQTYKFEKPIYQSPLPKQNNLQESVNKQPKVQTNANTQKIQNQQQVIDIKQQVTNQSQPNNQTHATQDQKKQISETIDHDENSIQQKQNSLNTPQKNKQQYVEIETSDTKQQLNSTKIEERQQKKQNFITNEENQQKKQNKN